MTEFDILKSLYQEDCIFARHHEQLRATITNFIIIVSAASISLTTFDGSLSLKDLPLTIFIFLLGCFGAVFSSKHYERVRLHLRRARKLREEIDKLVPSLNVTALRELANKEHEAKYGKLATIKLNNFWIALHIFISLIGLLLSVIILMN